MKHQQLICVIAILSMISTGVNAEFKRSCDARMFIELKPDNGFSASRKTLERFEARATCSGRATGRNKDKCRQKAVGIAFKCMQASWDERWNRKTPFECAVSRGVLNYGMPNIKCDIYDRICAEANEQGRDTSQRIRASVRGQTTGANNSCVVTNHGFGDYEVQACNAAQRAEHCGY